MVATSRVAPTGEVADAGAAAASLLDHVACRDDPRVDRTKRHCLLHMVVIALCGVIWEADTWVGIAQFGRTKRTRLGTSGIGRWAVLGVPWPPVPARGAPNRARRPNFGPADSR